MSKSRVSSQGRVVIPAGMRERLGIREGEEVEWTIEGGVMVVRPVREEKTPDEIVEYIRDHLVEIRAFRSEAASTDLEKRVMDEWARRKLGLTPSSM